MLHRLYVAGVMPAEPAGLPGIYICSHGPRPVGPVNARESLHHGVHDVREPVSALQCITAVACSARHLGQLRACLAMYCRKVVSVARHLAGLAQAACNLFSFCSVHITLSHKLTGLSSACCLRLGACGLRLDSRIFFCCSQ